MSREFNPMDFKLPKFPKIKLGVLKGIVLAVVVVVLLVGSVYQIKPEEIGVILRFGKFTRTVTTQSPPGTTVVQDEYEDKFKFSIEFAKRWGNLAIRLGLIESTGGVGADIYAFDDRFKFSIDTWNYNSKEINNENVHLRATANYDLTRTLFMNAGYDNALNPKRATPFVGFGLRFDDEDLKYLMGSVPVPK